MSTDIKFMESLLHQVGDYQMDHYTTSGAVQAKEKGRIDLVTEIDHSSEQQIVEALRERFPEDGILAEEDTTVEGCSGRRWIIDPLDGTTNYVHGHPFFGISVALMTQDKLEEGWVYFPALKDFYHARPGEHAHKNGQQINVSNSDEPMESLLATGFADMRTQNQRFNKPIFTDLIDRVQGIRRGGSAVHDLCLVAEGVFEGFWEFNLSPWDVAAGTVIIRQAGGRVTDMTGGNEFLNGKQILASGGSLHDTLINWVTPHLPENLT